jgi:pimeloyl-ACP methyl ester carboxylesterase
MADDGKKPDLEELVDRFERVAHARADTGKLDAPAEEVLAEVRDAAPVAPVPDAAPAASVAEPMPMPADIEAWWRSGERIKLDLPGGVRREIFARVLGDGPWLTMIHGFPTSSWDWVPMLPRLAASNRVLVFDLLGFGDSDKPAGHDWSAFEQADMVEALWKHFGAADTRVVAHDVGLTVALELLARQEAGKLSARMVDMTLLNGGVYAGFHRPRPIQVWLQRPVVGALMARVLNEARFGPALAEVFGPTHQPGSQELHQHWLSVARRDGSRNYHRLIKYIPERRANAPRWESALEQTSIPVRFVWGMADPVSGAHMAKVIRERRPGADVVELTDVGHYPQLEVPGPVADAILAGGGSGPAGQAV